LQSSLDYLVRANERVNMPESSAADAGLGEDCFASRRCDVPGSGKNGLSAARRKDGTIDRNSGAQALDIAATITVLTNTD
jgi:hypothetical protein